MTIGENSFSDCLPMEHCENDVSFDNDLSLFEDDPHFFDELELQQQNPLDKNQTDVAKNGVIPANNACFMSKSVLNLVAQIFKSPVSNDTLKSSISLSNPKIPFLNIRPCDDWLKTFNPNIVPECLDSEVFTERFMGDFLKVAFPLVNLLDVMSKGRLPQAKVETCVVDSLLLLSSALENVNDWRRESIMNRYNLNHLDAPDVSPSDRMSLFPPSFERTAKCPSQAELYQQGDSVPFLKIDPTCKFANDLLSGPSVLDSSQERVRKLFNESERRHNLGKDAFTQTMVVNKAQEAAAVATFKNLVSVGCQVSSVIRSPAVAAAAEMVLPSRENSASLETAQNNLKRKGSEIVSQHDSKKISLGEPANSNFRKIGLSSNQNIEAKAVAPALPVNPNKSQVGSSNGGVPKTSPGQNRKHLDKDVISIDDDDNEKLSALDESTDGSSSERDYSLSIITNDTELVKNASEQAAHDIVTSPLGGGLGESSLESGISIEEGGDESDEEIEPERYFGDLTSSSHGVLSIDEGVVTNASDEKPVEVAKVSEAQNSDAKSAVSDAQGSANEGPEIEEVKVPSTETGSKPVNVGSSAPGSQISRADASNTAPKGIQSKKKNKGRRGKNAANNNFANSQLGNISASRIQNASQLSMPPQPKRLSASAALLGEKPPPPMLINNSRLVSQQNVSFNDVRQSQANFMLQDRKISAPVNFRDARIFDTPQLSVSGLREPQMLNMMREPPSMSSMRGASPGGSQLNRPNDRIVRASFNHQPPQMLQSQSEYIPQRSLHFDAPLEIPSFSTPLFDSRSLGGGGRSLQQQQFDPRRNQPQRGNPYLGGRR